MAIAAPSSPAAAAVPPGAFAVPTAGLPAGKVDRTQWRTNFDSFLANLTVRSDPSGTAQVDWGELGELREMNDFALGRGNTAATPSPEAETPAAIAERLGDIHWQLVVEKVEPTPGGGVDLHFRVPELPKPLEIHIALDDTENRQNWSNVAPGTAVNVITRLTINEPFKITAKVRMAATN